MDRRANCRLDASALSILWLRHIAFEPILQLMYK